MRNIGAGAHPITKNLWQLLEVPGLGAMDIHLNPCPQGTPSVMTYMLW